jgi:hypothetical protein
MEFWQRFFERSTVTVQPVVLDYRYVCVTSRDFLARSSRHASISTRHTLTETATAVEWRTCRC